MTKITLEQLPATTSGKRMIKFVSPVYENSFWYKSYLDALGADFDWLYKFFATFHLQHFTETVDWAIEFQERKYSIEPDPNLSLEQRRERLKIKAATYLPINPAILERIARVNHKFDCVLDESHPGFIRIVANRPPSPDANGFIPWLIEEKPAHLALEGRLWLTYYVGDEKFSEDDGDIHSVTEPIFPLDDCDKRHFPRIFAGNAEVEAGGATFSLARPKTDYAAKVFAGNVDLIHGNATESLRKPNSDFETLIRAGVALKKSGVIRIGSKTQPSTDESHFARSWTSKSFAGTVLDVRGRQFWNLKLPTKEFVQTFATTAELQTGRISIDTRREQNLAHEIKLHAATVLNRSGAITIGSQTQPTADENYFTQSFKSKITTSTATLRTGRLTFGDETTRHKRKTVVRVGCVQKVTGYVTIGCNDIQEWPPLPEFGNWLTLRFRFATNPSKRFVTLKNPREDLVKDDIREVSKFSAATGILLNAQKSPTTGIDLAMIKRRSERKIL